MAKKPVFCFHPVMICRPLVCPNTGWSGPDEEEAHRFRARRPLHTPLNGPPDLLRDADPNRFPFRPSSVSVSSCPRILRILSSDQYWDLSFSPLYVHVSPSSSLLCFQKGSFASNCVSAKMSSSLSNGKNIKVFASQIECLCITQVFSV